MNSGKLIAGTYEQATNCESEYWIIVDLGFSKGSASCGLKIGNSKPVLYTFAKTKHEINAALSKDRNLCNLLIEAPLSGAMGGGGNPAPRLLEFNKQNQARCWYCGPGATTKLAALHFLDDLVKDVAQDVHLFEAFLSFKPKGKRSDHLKDVRMLHLALDDLKNQKPEDMRSKDYTLFSISRFLTGQDFEVPPVLKCEPSDGTDKSTVTFHHVP